MDIAGLSYHIDGECWICDDERAYAIRHGGQTEWRITLSPEEKVLHRGPFHVSVARYVYIDLHEYTDNAIRHRCAETRCINPDHIYESTHSTRIHGYGTTICLNCFCLKQVKGTGGEKVRCDALAYKNGEDFPYEEAFENGGRIRPNCPDCESEEEQHWSIEKYRQMKINLIQPTFC